MSVTDGEEGFTSTLSLAGRVALVTGAGGAGVGGLGVVFATALAAAGASVVVSDIDGDAAQAVAGALSAKGGKAIGCQVDVTKDADVHALVDLAQSTYGGVDILVNNAGLARGRWSLGIDLSTEEWQQIFSVNVVGAVVCARACRPAMVARGRGVIVNITSMGAYRESGAYSVSKAALASLNNLLAAELGPDNIRVNAIAPGMMTAKLAPEQVARVVSEQKLQRQGSPRDLVGALLYLCSDSSSFVTGTTIRVDGGMIRGHI
ncbi:SDR family NAD(P)-dependent oxidoreductase [uncultured Jatrophihabitans sp.]|uniref:SDR family NAD(P)-dependent oxidoreductase n=1 Tax=uncultured Jatrophihabitans sp. TaxID=1610747 RepID=UPI0035CA4FBB